MISVAFRTCSRSPRAPRSWEEAAPWSIRAELDLVDRVSRRTRPDVVQRVVQLVARPGGPARPSVASLPAWISCSCLVPRSSLLAQLHLLRRLTQVVHECGIIALRPCARAAGFGLVRRPGGMWISARRELSRRSVLAGEAAAVPARSRRGCAASPCGWSPSRLFRLVEVTHDVQEGPRRRRSASWTRSSSWRDPLEQPPS